MTHMTASGIDTSSDYDKLNRVQVNKLLDVHGIQHPPFCKKTVGIKLLEANDISARDGIEWTQVPVTNERGDTVFKDVPKTTTPVRPENWDELKAEQLARVNAEKEAEQKDDEIASLKKMVAELTALVKKEKKQPETDPAKMKYMAFKKWCKDRGHVLEKGEDRAELIAKLTDVDIPLSTD